VVTSRGQSLIILLAATGVDGDNLTYELVNQVSHGTLTLQASQASYTPTADYIGNDSFTFRASDGQLQSQAATVSITVKVANRAPTATDSSLSSSEEQALSVKLTASDADGDLLSYTIVSQPNRGSLSGTAPNLTYQPQANFSGGDSLTFKASDGQLSSQPATISITIQAVNDAPLAQTQSVSLQENATGQAIKLAGSDVEGSALSYSLVSQPSHGSLTGAAPQLSYQPNSGYVGADSFSFKVSDGVWSSQPATVNLTISAKPRPRLSLASNSLDFQPVALGSSSKELSQQ